MELSEGISVSVPHYFIGIELNSSAKEKIEEIKKSWADKFSFKQWTHREDVHITLAFLGAVEDEVVKRYQILLNEVIPAVPITEVLINEVNYFGRPESPRILWIGPDEGDKEKLQPIYTVVQQVVEQAGGQTEKRPFRPHITLAKKWTGGDSFQLPEEFDSFKLVAASVCLFRIHPSVKPKYEIITRVQLN